ncbi:MAG TPA: ATP-binding protein, partial [Verrucomicrobiae bacterium]
QVRAIDHNGNIENTPAELEFNVVVPWYREERLVAVLALALLVSLSLGALALNRHRRLQHSYAQVEQLVADRTRELELANRELLHSQKMTALGTLAAGIAHDFNNILSIIKGSAQIIEDNVDNPEKIRTRTGRIQTVVQQGAEVVDAMLGFSRADSATGQACDINAVVADTRRLLGDRFLHETEVQFKPGDALPAVSAARDFVQQILLNFIFNAHEAASQRIEISTVATEKLPAEIYLPPAGAARFILVTVRDFGTGIAPEIRPRIFEPFFTTKNMSARRGTGLGLSMVYQLASKMGAGLAVESTPGAGSTFTLILPVKIS